MRRGSLLACGLFTVMVSGASAWPAPNWYSRLVTAIAVAACMSIVSAVGVLAGGWRGQSKNSCERRPTLGEMDKVRLVDTYEP